MIMKDYMLDPLASTTLYQSGAGTFLTEALQSTLWSTWAEENQREAVFIQLGALGAVCLRQFCAKESTSHNVQLPLLLLLKYV